MFEPLAIVISREEVEAQNIAPALSLLNTLIASPEKAKSYQEKVDVAFHGYDDDQRELFEIPEVRHFVYKLDEAFPFWLFFLSKHFLGLQCLLLCFLPPFLTDEAKAKIFPEKVEAILLNRWMPAMNQVSEYAGLSEQEIEQLTERAIDYIQHGRLLF